MQAIYCYIEGITFFIEVPELWSQHTLGICFSKSTWNKLPKTTTKKTSLNSQTPNSQLEIAITVTPKENITQSRSSQNNFRTGNWYPRTITKYLDFSTDFVEHEIDWKLISKNNYKISWFLNRIRRICNWAYWGDEIQITFAERGRIGQQATRELCIPRSDEREVAILEKEESAKGTRGKEWKLGLGHNQWGEEAEL